MPVKKVGDKFEVNKETYDTEKEAKNAYMSYISKAFGVKEEASEEGKEDDKDSKPKKKKK